MRQYGVKRLAEAMTNRGATTRVSFGMVYQWLRREHEPRGPKARLIVKLSEGALSLEDLAAHFAKRHEVGPGEKTRRRARPKVHQAGISAASALNARADGSTRAPSLGPPDSRW